MCVSVVDRGGRELVSTRHLAGVLYPHPTEDRQIKHTPPPIETREKKKKKARSSTYYDDKASRLG